MLVPSVRWWRPFAPFSIQQLGRRIPPEIAVFHHSFHCLIRGSVPMAFTSRLFNVALVRDLPLLMVCNRYGLFMIVIRVNISDNIHWTASIHAIANSSLQANGDDCGEMKTSKVRSIHAYHWIIRFCRRRRCCCCSHVSSRIQCGVEQCCYRKRISHFVSFPSVDCSSVVVKRGGRECTHSHGRHSWLRQVGVEWSPFGLFVHNVGSSLVWYWTKCLIGHSLSIIACDEDLCYLSVVWPPSN